jgi:hypothetical protein
MAYLKIVNDRLTGREKELIFCSKDCADLDPSQTDWHDWRNLPFDSWCWKCQTPILPNTHFAEQQGVRL